MTNEELTTIVQAVVNALLTNGKTLAQLTAVESISDDDYFEIDTGRKVSYETLRDAIVAAAAEGIQAMEVVDYDGRDEIKTFYYYSNSGIISIKQQGRSSMSITIPLASASKRGLMDKLDKSKLEYAYEKVGEILESLGDYVTRTEWTDGYSAIVRKETGKNRVTALQDNFTPLASMGYDLDNIDGGDFTYTYAETDAWYDPSTKKVCYLTPGAVGYNSFNPSTEVIYYNSHSGHAYRWNGSDMVEAFAVLDTGGRVPTYMIPPSALASMGSDIDNAGSLNQWVYSPAVGDYYYDGETIKYVKAEGVTIDLGLPSKSMIYANRHTNHLYKWAGATFTQLS